MENIDLTTRTFDPANYLKTPEDMAAYLGVVAESGDTSRFVRAMGDIIRAHNMSALSRQSGISREGIRKAFAPDGNPSLDTLVSVTAALGLSMQFTPVADAEAIPGRYVRKAKATADGSTRNAVEAVQIRKRTAAIPSKRSSAPASRRG
jgi:probable addiction module antidote protein